MKLQVMWDCSDDHKSSFIDSIIKERNGSVASAYFLSATADHTC